jgi:hypothetical protein
MAVKIGEKDLKDLPYYLREMLELDANIRKTIE